MIKLTELFDWYFETNPTCADIENELKYNGFDLSLADFFDKAMDYYEELN